MKLFSKKMKKALIIGVDGVPHSLLTAYMKSGVMSNLGKILSRGLNLHQMNASIPDISSVSWTSFVTGVNPGEHGIFGFTDLKPNSYSLYFPNAMDRKAPTVWEILGKTNDKASSLSRRYEKKINRSYRSVILNVPHTYPSYPMNGILVSGFVAIDLKKATYPESAYAYLNSIDYRIDVDAEKAKESKKELVKDLWDCFETRRKAITYFFKNEPWDLFFTCITETDRLNHFFYDASQDPSNSYRQEFSRFMTALDQFIKDLYDVFMKECGGSGFFMILSDHGFAPLKEEVYINAFLQKEGFLVLKEEGNFYERIGDQTKAFDLDPGRIYIHDQESYPGGKVRKEDRNIVLREVEDVLRGLKGSDGSPVLHRICHRDEIYSGPFTERAPDLVCLPMEGYDLKGSLEKRETFGRYLFTGMHTWHDAFCILPESFRLSKKPSIEEMADLILKHFTQ